MGIQNKLINLNDHLFEQLERLNDEDLKGADLELEIKRSHAMAKVANAITSNASVSLSAMKFIQQEGLTPGEVPEMLKIESKPESVTNPTGKSLNPVNGTPR